MIEKKVLKIEKVSGVNGHLLANCPPEDLGIVSSICPVNLFVTDEKFNYVMLLGPEQEITSPYIPAGGLVMLYNDSLNLCSEKVDVRFIRPTSRALSVLTDKQSLEREKKLHSLEDFEASLPEVPYAKFRVVESLFVS